MFIPLFIAMLLGLANPSITPSPNGAKTTINATNAKDENPGDQHLGDDTGGELGQIPPPKIN